MNKNYKKHNSLENLKIVFETIFNHSITTIDHIYGELQNNHKLSKPTIYRKLEKLKDDDFIFKERGRPNVYKLNPSIKQLFLELNKQDKVNFSKLTIKLEYTENQIIKIIDILNFYGILSGEIISKDSKIYFQKF